MDSIRPEIEIIPATVLESPEELRAVLNSAVSDPITHEPDYEDIDEILALVPRTEAELAERYCAIARDTNTAQLLGMMTLKHPNEVMRRFAVTDNPIEIDDAYALNMRTGVGSSLVRHVESEALKRGHGETVLVSGPRYESRGWNFWTSLYGAPVGVAEKYFEGNYNGIVWRKLLSAQIEPANITPFSAERWAGSEFVTVIKSDANDSEVPVVTAENLRSFLWHRGGNRGTGGRAYNTLMAHAKLDDEGPLGELASYFVHDQNGVPVGVRPERLRDIVDDIRSGAIYVKNFGKPSENLLLSLYFELFPEQVEDQ